MTADPKGRDLFIVDNSVSGWTGLRYLEEWAGIAKAFDIATGYFEIGALLALDGQWQSLDNIRILMGAETTYRTRTALLDAVRGRAVQILDGSLEENKGTNPFLHGVPAILDALRSGQIECRVYDKDKFHAKAYITHAKLEVVGSQALVGSSNFTAPGLTKNIELNIQVQSAREVAQLQEWFETHWNAAAEVTDAVIETIARHTHRYTPFDVYAKALQEYFRGHELTATEWDETSSKMFPRIDRYQQEAYRALMKIARQHGGAFLCDGVGLGKTFVGLMLIERLVLHEGKRVVLFAPKATKEGVWEPHLREWLPHIGGVGGHADFSNLAVFSHTDLGRKGDFPERFRRIAELADIVVIDEAHNTMAAKWKSQGHGEKKSQTLWNEYVPKHLLPRLHGYEVLMAPYAIAHLKIGLKLFETGYGFESDERARVYLTNALEPAEDEQLMLDFLPALAHEAKAVNEIKRKQRFTVVMGNPPYSGLSSNMGSWIDGLLKGRQDQRPRAPPRDEARHHRVPGRARGGLGLPNRWLPGLPQVAQGPEGPHALGRGHRPLPEDRRRPQ